MKINLSVLDLLSLLGIFMHRRYLLANKIKQLEQQETKLAVTTVGLDREINI